MTESDNLIDRLRIEDSVRESGSSRRAWIATVIVISLVVIGLATVWFWHGKQQGLAVAVVSPAMLETGASAPLASVLDASGFVVARRQATVAAEVTGKLIDVLVEEGMEVEAGQVLARLDDATEQARLELARARVISQQRDVREIEVRLEDAVRTLNRFKQLRTQELVSQADVDQAETAFNSLTAQLDSARQRVLVVEREVQLQEQLLEELTVRAPFSGVVIARAAQAGEMVSPISAGGGFTRTGICTIVDMSSLEIEVDVNEAFIDRVSPGQGVIAILDAYPDWEIPAEVTTVVPAADRQKATVRVRIGFLELDPRILPDMGIQVRFLDADPVDLSEQTMTRNRVPAVPSTAIVDVNGNRYLFIVDDGLAERRAVRTGPERGAMTMIIAGLSESELVITKPRNSELTDGTRVRISED